MFMTPEIRRTIILLEGIPTSAREDVTVRVATGDAFLSGLRFLQLDERRNVAVFETTADTVTVARGGRIHVCLDDVVTVFEAPNGRWRVHVRSGAILT